MALALEIPARDIVSLLEKYGPKVFPHRKRLLTYLWKAKYCNKQLKQMFDDELFGNYTLKDSSHRLLITSVNFSTGKPQFFKTPHHTSLREDCKVKISDIALATSASPIYFPIFYSKNIGSCYVDGGLVGNAPGLFGVHEARHFCHQDIEDVYLLSIGTMSGEFRVDASKTLNRGVIQWGDRLFSLTISAQEKVTDFMLQHQLGRRYQLIDELPTYEQEKNIGLDMASIAAIQTLKSMGKESAKRFISKPEAVNFLSHTAQSFDS